MDETLVEWEREGFKLEIYDNAKWKGSRAYLPYKFTCNGHTIFEGDDFSPSPVYEWGAPEIVAALLSFLCLQEYDVEEEYFESYTPEQIAWRDQYAEELSYVRWEWVEEMGIEE